MLVWRRGFYKGLRGDGGVVLWVKTGCIWQASVPIAAGRLVEDSWGNA